MTEAEEFEQHSAELAAELRSPWQPRCIARAWRTPGEGDLVFTMQTWIDLDAARSPLLAGRAPETIEELAGAFAIFGIPFDAATPPEEAALIVAAMRRAIEEGFAAALPMRPPEAADDDGADGFGVWLPLLACLVTQCGLEPEAALRLGVTRAHMLISAHRRNQGWEVAGQPYAVRDMEGFAPSKPAFDQGHDGACPSRESADA